jgi:hypothetical protein
MTAETCNDNSQSKSISNGKSTATAKATAPAKKLRQHFFHPLCSADGFVDEVLGFGLDLL